MDIGICLEITYMTPADEILNENDQKWKKNQMLIITMMFNFYCSCFCF